MNHLEPPFSSNRPIGNVLRAEIGKLDAEIERLWAELTASGRRAVLMQAEIEKLNRELLERDAIWLPEKDAEIERLNAALDEIAAYDPWGGRKYLWAASFEELQAIARAARSNEKESN